MTKSVLFGAAALALTVTAAQAAENINSANDVIRGCRDFVNRNSSYGAGWCAGIVRGMVGSGILVAFALKITKPDAVGASWLKPFRVLCMDIPPHKVTLGQEIRVVVAYIEARPARMHEEFEDLALEALQAAWPCK